MDDQTRLLKLKKEHLEVVLVQWIEKRKKSGQPLDDKIVLEQTRFYLDHMNMTRTCDYSELWLKQFKKKHSITYQDEENDVERNHEEEVQEYDDVPEVEKDLNAQKKQHATRSNSRKAAKSAIKMKKKKIKKQIDYDSDEAPLIHIKQEKNDESSLGYFNNQKRKHVQLTISEKVEMLKKMAKGISDDDLIQEYNVGRATLYDIRRKKNKLYSYYKDRKEFKNFDNKKSIRCGRWPEIENVVFKWYVDRRTEGHQVYDQEIMNKARDVHSKMGFSDEFMYSATWLRNFKVRRQFKHLETLTEGFTKNLDKIKDPEQTVSSENNDLFVNEIELNPLNVPVRRRRRTVPMKPKVKPVIKMKPKPIILSSCQDQELKPIVMQLNNYIFCQTENDIFGKYVSCQLENMSISNRCTAQERIQAILTHYRLQAVNRTEEES